MNEYLQAAIEEAEQGLKEGGIPIGAVMDVGIHPQPSAVVE